MRTYICDYCGYQFDNRCKPPPGMDTPPPIELVEVIVYQEQYVDEFGKEKIYEERADLCPRCAASIASMALKYGSLSGIKKHVPNFGLFMSKFMDRHGGTL